MNKQRWKELVVNPNLKLTQQEIEQGWHFCSDFDGLIIGPTMGMEWEYCSCKYPSVLAIKSNLTRTERTK